MINKLILKNFQAHKATELKFCSGVNAIIGESDEGKTSIIRALNWTAKNQPSGGDFISDFSKRGECSSTIIVDGNEVSRFKNKSKNEYRINDQPFKALGKSGVPDEVKDILQLGELNFQNQMDAPFLLSASSGEVARYLNKVADLDIISESLTKINSKVNNCNTAIKNKEADIEADSTALKELDWVEVAEKELLLLEDDYFEFKNADSKQEYLIDILEETDIIVEKLEPYQDLDLKENSIIDLRVKALLYESDLEENRILCKLLDEIDDINETIDKYKDYDQELYDLQMLINEYLSYEKGLELLDTFKGSLNSVKTILKERDSYPLRKDEIALITVLYDSITLFNLDLELLNEFDYLISDIEDYQQKIKIKDLNIQELESEFKRDFPKQCPLCNQEV